jgi:pimeloyl-ACP methyl ester carboxylesterase
VALIAVLALVTVLAPSSVVQDVRAAVPCEALTTVDLPETVAVTAELDSDGSAAGQTGLPEFCRVALTVAPQINIEVWLPTATYNDRFQAVGGGGYAGSISFGAMANALRAGYATASTDTGHTGFSGGFALNPDGTLNWQLIEDFASRSLFQLTEKSHTLIDAFYGQPADYAYWNGCSTGGRQGLMLAQRFPDGYDGILAGAPAINWDRFHPAHLWPQLVRLQEVGGPIANCKYDAVTAAAVAHCDSQDGVVDGILDDPRRCDFDPHTMVGADLGACGALTEAEADAIALMWDGPRDGDSDRLWYGLTIGTPMGALAGPSPFFIGLQHAQLWVNQDPTWDWQTLTYETYPDFFGTSVEKFNDVIGTDDPDLSAFRDSGGRVLMWHGWADPLIFPEGTVDYYDRVIDRFHSTQQVQGFARLFMAPGVGHCGGGAGPNQFDMFGALVAWVEQGDAPDRIMATRAEGGAVVRTRPLCAYPFVPRFDGKGDPSSASSFECKPNYGQWGTPNRR